MRRERFAKSLCPATGKVRYRTYFDARAAASDIRYNFKEDHGHPYRCSECDGFHLGRPRDRADPVE